MLRWQLISSEWFHFFVLLQELSELLYSWMWLSGQIIVWMLHRFPFLCLVVALVVNTFYRCPDVFIALHLVLLGMVMWSLLRVDSSYRTVLVDSSYRTVLMVMGSHLWVDSSYRAVLTVTGHHLYISVAVMLSQGKTAATVFEPAICASFHLNKSAFHFFLRFFVSPWHIKWQQSFFKSIFGWPQGQHIVFISHLIKLPKFGLWFWNNHFFFHCLRFLWIILVWQSVSNFGWNFLNHGEKQNITLAWVTLSWICGYANCWLLCINLN